MPHTLLDVLPCVFIPAGTDKHTQPHRGLVAVSGGFCSSIQQSISRICPNIEPSRAGYLSPTSALNVQYHVTEGLWVSYWQGKHIHLSPKETHVSSQMKWREAGGQFVAGKQNHIQAFALVLKVDCEAPDDADSDHMQLKWFLCLFFLFVSFRLNNLALSLDQRPILSCHSWFDTWMVTGGSGLNWVKWPT